MIKNNQGSIVTITLLVLEFLIIVGISIFSVNIYSSRQDYKNNVNSKIAVAVAAEKNLQTTIDANNYANQSQYPLTNYTGPSDYGSISINYPKTWSAYVDTTGNNTFVDAYFNPNYVPSITLTSQPYALRVQIINQSYSSSLSNFNSLEQNGTVTAAPYSLPKVPQVVGVRLSGQIFNNLNGSLVVLPLRNETLEIWTIGQNFLSQFNNIILPNFTFSP